MTDLSVKRRVALLEGADGGDADLCTCERGDGMGRRIVYLDDEGVHPEWRTEPVDNTTHCVECSRERETLTITYTRQWRPARS